MFRSSNIAESRKCFLEKHRNTYLTNALYDAVIDANLTTVKFLLEYKNVNPNFLVPEYDAAPLHAAPGIGKEDIAYLSVDMLLSHGADPNISTSDGTTPLMISCLWGREKIVKLLLNRGADPFLEDAEDKNSFEYAQESDKESVYTVLNEFLNEILFSRLTHVDIYNSIIESDPLNVCQQVDLADLANISVEFTDIESDSNMIEFYSLNNGFRHTNKSNNGEPSKNFPMAISDTNNPLNPCKSQQCKDNQEEESDDNSFSSIKSSTSQFSVKSCATDHLKNELKINRIMHGPVTQSTKKVYQRLLLKVIKGKQSIKMTDEFSNYPEILRNTFKDNFIDLIKKWHPLEALMSNNFSDPKKVWRGGKEKQFFTYLLLDPFKTDNLALRKNGMKEVDIWKTFVFSIFYVGKGKNSRPFSHLYEALKTMKKKTLSSKVRRIQAIWDKSAGVICLHIFHNVITAEAHTREAAMIDAIGSSNLTNIQNGEYYGVVKNWSIKQKRQLGVVLLYKALQIYLAEGERQIFASDLT